MIWFEILKKQTILESLAASMPEAAHYTRRSAAYLHGNPTPTTLPKRKTYRTADRNQLYGRRQDGVYVRYFLFTRWWDFQQDIYKTI
jgi:hypothetical protein